VDAIRTSNQTLQARVLYSESNDFRLCSSKWWVSIYYKLHNVKSYTRNKPTQTEACSPNPRVQVCGMRGRFYSKHFNLQRYAVQTQLQHNFDSRVSWDKMVNPWMTQQQMRRIFISRCCQFYFPIAYPWYNFKNCNKRFKIIYKTDVKADHACYTLKTKYFDLHMVKIWGFHSGGYEEFCLLRYNATAVESTDVSKATCSSEISVDCRRATRLDIPVYVCVYIKQCRPVKVNRRFGGDMFLWNVGRL
jgi:hypothetical protein